MFTDGGTATCQTNSPYAVSAFFFLKTSKRSNVFGPVQIFGMLKNRFEVLMLDQEATPRTCAQGPTVQVDAALDDAGELDLLLVPGGMGTRTEVGNEEFLSSLQAKASECTYVTSVCTGAALLARAGLLDGRRATSNKLAFEWVTTQGPEVEWVKQARWVADGKFWTSSGVSAGIDMSLALVEEMLGGEIAGLVANAAEYERHEDPAWDPFSALYEFTRS